MKPSNIGGQAVMEGIMMRHKDKYAVAVRRPDKEIEIKVEDGKLAPITRQFFIDHIFDFRKWKKWQSNTKGKCGSTK